MRLDIFVHVLHTIFTHSSLISAVFISFESFYAIFWQLKHRRRSVREYFIIILTTWFLAIIVCAVHNAEHYFHLGLSFYGWVLFPLVFLSAVCVLNIGILMKFHWGGLGSHFTAAKQICAEYETTDKNAVVCIYDCHTFLASPTHW